MQRRRLLLATATGLLAAPGIVSAQGGAWPSRGSIRIVVPFPPGGFSDFVARVLTGPMGATLGQTVVVENRPGAGGTVGADHIAKSPPDGYSFIVSHVSPHGTAPGVYPQLPYDPINDFTHLALVCETPMAIMVRRDSPIRSFEDWVAKMRGPGLRVGTSGMGSIAHLQVELLARRLGATRMEHVPYRGTAPSLQDLMAGVIESSMDPMAGLVPQLTGTAPLRAILLSGKARLAALPDVPLYSEKGQAEVDAMGWMGISGPKGLPPEIGRRMTEALLGAMARPEIRQRMDELAVFAPASPVTGDAYVSYIRDFVGKWTPVARAANIVAS